MSAYDRLLERLRSLPGYEEPPIIVDEAISEARTAGYRAGWEARIAHEEELRKLSDEIADAADKLPPGMIHVERRGPSREEMALRILCGLVASRSLEGQDVRQPVMDAFVLADAFLSHVDPDQGDVDPDPDQFHGGAS